MCVHEVLARFKVVLSANAFVGHVIQAAMGSESACRDHMNKPQSHTNKAAPEFERMHNVQGRSPKIAWYWFSPATA